MTNVAYVLGFDGIYYDTSARQFRTVNQPNSLLRRNRVRVNKILPTLQRRTARLCKNLPRFEVRPDDGTQEARDRARNEEQILEFYFDKERIPEKRIQLTMGLQQCGHYYLKVGWDANKGEFLQDPETGEMMQEGDLSVEVFSAFECFPDPLAKTLDDCKKFTTAKVRKLDYFKTHYPERGHLVKEEGAWLLSVQYEARINTLAGLGPTSSGIANQIEGCAIELCHYEEPSNKHPKGRLIVTANGVLLKESELPAGEIPFAKFDDVIVAGKYFSEAVCTHLRPIQDQYNRTISSRAAWVNRCAHGKYIAAKGHGIIQEGFNDQSGEIVEYDPLPGVPEPHAIQVPVIPSYMYEEEDKLNQNFYDISGEGDISRGVLPAAGIPAIGMQLLLEQDETRISIETTQHEYAFARCGRLMLKYLEKFVTNERLLKLTGPDGDYQIKTWTGEDLTSKHDVIVKRGSLAPASKAQKRNDLINLYTQGLLGPIGDPQVITKLLRNLEFGDLQDVWKDQSLDMGQTKKKIAMIEAGIAPDVHEADNHTLAWQEMNRYRKSDKYDALKPEVQAIFDQVMEEHLQEMMKITAPMGGMSPDPATDIEMFNARLDEEALAAGDEGPEDEVAQEELNQPPMGEEVI